MKNRRIWLAVLCASVVGVLLTDGCGTATKRQWLTTFFDGVPESTGTNVVVAPVATETNAADAVFGARAAAPEMIVNTNASSHPPFAKQQCTECHEAGGGQGMRVKLPDLCFNCHKDFLTGVKVKHQPVAEGDCMSCHEPHESNFKHLLVKKGNDLCLNCHDDPLAAGRQFRLDDPPRFE